MAWCMAPANQPTDPGLVRDGDADAPTQVTPSPCKRLIDAMRAHRDLLVAPYDKARPPSLVFALKVLQASPSTATGTADATVEASSEAYDVK